MILVPALLSLAAPAQALLFSHTEPRNNDNYGNFGIGLGDVNGDGYPDYAVTAETDSLAALYAGRVYIFSGRDGSILKELSGNTANEAFGLRIQAIGDFNGDGRPDVMIGHTGATVGLRYRIISGRDWTVLRSIPDVAALPSHKKLLLVDDVNNDGVREILCADYMYSTNFSSLGKVWLISGANLNVLFSTQGTATNEYYGSDIAALGDMDGDGIQDFLIGAPGRNANGFNTGVVELRSGADWHAIYAFSAGSEANSALGETIRVVGDVDGDGYSDFAASQSNYSSPTLSKCGRVRVYSGKTGVAIPQCSWLGEAANQYFSRGMEALGDIDNDGVPDLGCQNDLSSSSSPGVVRVFSCKSGAEAMRFTGVPSQYYVRVLGTCGDVNRDGSSDIMILRGPANYLNPGTTVVCAGIPNTGIGNPLYRAPTFHTLSGANPNDQFGWSVHGGGDLDGDGYSDFLVGANAVDVGSFINAGEVRAYSGRNATVMMTFRGTQNWNYLGDSACIVGDVNHDGRPDILLGGHGFASGALIDVGQATLYSGLDGSKLKGFFGTQSLQSLGQVVASAGDVDKDGDCDVILGAPGETRNGAQSGCAYVYGGATKNYALLWRFDGDSANDAFGSAVAGIGDSNGDGYADVAVGAPKDDVAPLVDCGTVKIFSGKDGALLRTLNGFASGDHFGSTLAGIGDVDGDGTSDLLVGAPDADLKGIDSGRAYVFSGKTGAILQMFDGQATGEHLGASVGAAGDVDKDGRPDVILGCPGAGPNGTSGRALVYSGRTGRLIYWLEGNSEDDTGVSVAGAGDVTGDGYADLIVGGSQTSSQAGPGVIRVISGTDAVSLPFGSGCPGTGGRVPDIAGNSIPRIGNAAHKIDLQRGRPSAPAVLGIGVDLLQLPIGGSCVLIPNITVTLSLATNGVGSASIPIPIPNLPAIIGGNIYCQCAIYDLAGAGLGALAMSQGLHLLLGR